MASEALDEMFARTLSGEYDDDLPWKAVHSLRTMGSREVFDYAAEWCGSENPLQRARGTDVLAQLGRTVDPPSNNFPDESFTIVSSLVQGEKESLPLLAGIYALGHIGNSMAIPLIIQNRFHPSPDIRLAVACALGNFTDDIRAVEILIPLTKDVDDDVRDWATFNLGVIGKLDSSEIRNVLYQRLADSNEDVREESLVGLAQRKEPRVLPVLIAELNRPEASDRVKEAADALLSENEDHSHWSTSEYIAALKQRFPDSL